MNCLSFEESIIMLSKMVSFYKKDEFKKKVLDAAKTNPLSLIFPNSILNDEGQTVFSLPGLNLSNPEENPQVLNDYIHREMHQDQSLSGGLSIRYALLYIKEHFDIDNENLDFLINDNLVIPTDRTEIIRSAIVMALKGQFYESLHILAPQTEKIFRNIAKELGALTVTLENDGTSNEKTLSSVFDLPELVDCYDNDILFLFKGLLHEKAGANIRNNIAHGIMSPQSANSGASLYFICVFIKLLVFSSKRCHEIVNDNPNFN